MKKFSPPPRILRFKKEGEDYTINNGRIVSNDVSYSLVDVLGLYRGSLPAADETIYYKNIRKQKEDLYSSSQCHTSKFAGFQPDLKDFTDVSFCTDAGEKYYDVWKENSFEDAYKDAKKTVSGRQTKLLKELEKQYEKWKQNVMHQALLLFSD